ncbi:delta-aminolevulinic acid dehydratase [Salinibacter sp. 10B]|uniref:porphobilinogen synthase n=1 Tax=Salinibacter sp. 10B TaxID=1923971 RepID=UPI000CF4E3D6|nr:porphobilinogen synthase [Salinibacter sp. 10B]PQJ34077.1 delta-aminolevulinic acid dehydratase [Salinibacter sp. 10B]
MPSSADYDLPLRPRRLRRTENIRRMARETRLSTDNLIAPLFVMEGENEREEVPSMPDTYRHTVDRLVDKAETLSALGIPAVALFPAIPAARKTPDAAHALEPDHLYPNAVRALKEAVPELMVITDTALDPYNSDGHDGIVRDGEIVNDATIDVMRDMAVLHAEAGADIVAPSDMMDGRVGLIREALDHAGHANTAILSYTAKYSSAYYGPFRDALDSAPKGDEEAPDKAIPDNKDTYQMDPANSEEAVRELMLDLEEGADMVMVKPALPYLDVIHRVKQHSDVPVAAYNVSGEYAMIKAAAQNGWLDEKNCALEALTGIRRAGADLILTYFAEDAARWID